MPSGEVMGVQKPPTAAGVGGLNEDTQSVYNNDDEYDEDLAQLDMLLHYVNNLSASLEFLAWENKRISTDLVPTLLNMYDALYARLSEGGDTTTTTKSVDRDEGGGKGGGGGGGGEEKMGRKGFHNGNLDLSRIGEEEQRTTGTTTTKENGNVGATERGSGPKANGDARLFIEEEEEEEEEANQANNNCVQCAKCGVLRASGGACRCGAKCSIAESISSMFEGIEHDLDGGPESLYDNVVDKRRPPHRRREHIYAEPQFLIKPKDSPKSTASSSSANTCSSFSSSTSTAASTSSSDKLPATPTSPPLGFDPRKLKDVYRPLSSISSSSSSSSSSNSLPRGPPGAATSYLASAESLEDNDADHSDTEETTRRRDRTIKARREKAQRTGSGDSGVQCHSISLPAPPTLRPRYCDPNLAYMDRIVLEIVETEAIYVRDLKEIIEGYLEYWRRQSESGVSQKQVDDLFSNIEQIYAFNKGFLSELEACGVDPVQVARCFVRNNNGFAIYTQYCTNYPRTVSVLTELMRGEAPVRAFRERQLALGHTLPLGSYLLKPVQRILKYHLLLGNIVKHFEKECAGYSEIWNALSAMTGMAHHINDMKRRHEHAVRVQEIQSLLYGWQFEDLTTYGELAAEGTFRMWGAKGLRHVFLFDKMLLVAKKKEENILMYKTHILCSNLMLIESVPGEPLSFHVIPFDNPRMQYTLEARSLEQKREWTLQLKRVILENYSANIPAHARQLVMELGQSKPDDVLMSEVRSSGRRAHHAPEYLEKRKVDRERRRSSEGGLNTKLRIRRSSRTRKEKEEKVSRSRSVSRTRDTEDEEVDRKVSTTSAPASAEKPKLKLTMWGRRRSEPGIGSRESLSLASTINLDETLDTPPASLCETPQQMAVETPTGPTTPEVSLDGASMSEFEREDAESSRTAFEEGSENGENLEEIISQLLQNKLQLQKLLLNKQRRGLLRKKLALRYETSDTENEDGPFKANGSYAGSEAGDALRAEDVGDYVDFYFGGKEGEGAAQPESANVSSSECQSMYSSAVSVHQPCDAKSLAAEKKTKPVRRSSSDLSFKKMPSLKKMNSNYDNLLNIWSTIRGKSPEKRQSALQAARLSQTPSASLERPKLRRAQSFSADKCLSNTHENIYVSAAQLTPQPHTAPAEPTKPPEVWVRDESPREGRERPVTIAFYNSNEVSLSALEQYLNQPRPPGRCNERFPYDTEDNMTDYSMTPHMSMDNILSIHPEHKIYKTANNKSTLKTVLNKITSPRNNKTASEPSPSLYNYSVQSDLDKGSDKRASKMVYNMARQCSKTLKERIKQIRAEDVEKAPAPKSPTDAVFALPLYKQGSSSIGARLAGTNEPSDYAVPRIRPLDQKPKSDLRPDSVLSSSSILTSSSSSSSSSSRDTKFLESTEVSNHNMANVEEENEENQETPSFDSDASADSYYERSFEAIENLETEIFRDSAIYSDPEDTESPPNSLNQDRSCTSPKVRSPSSKKFSTRSSTKATKTTTTTSPTRHASPEIVVTPEDPSPSAEGERSPSNGVAPPSPRSSPQPKKVPPPVPAKPDSIKTKRPCGNLIMQQLKNLEECTKFSREEQANGAAFDGFRTLDDRRKELEESRLKGDEEEPPAASPRGSPERENSGDRTSRSQRSPSLMTPPIIKNPITLSPLSLPVTRSSSVPPRLSPRPSLTPESEQPASVGTLSPAGSERASPLPATCQDVDELDEPRVARGWVRHVIGKLQAETDV